MLVLLGHSLIERFGLLVASQSSLLGLPSVKSIQASQAASLGNANITSSSGQTANSSGKTQKSSDATGSSGRRVASNPFDVLYGSTPVSNRVSALKVQSPQYLQIENDILAGHSRAASPISPNYPTVTLIDKTSRSGSVVSRNTTLRHRNTIRLRNKMARRTDVTEGGNSSSLVFSRESKPSKPKRSKIAFVFPVKRRSSYKYHTVSRHSLNSSQRFNSQQEVDNYFVLNNIASLMKDALPRTMATFQYKNLIKVEPDLVSKPAQFAISRDAKFTLLQNKPLPQLAKKAAFQGRPLYESTPKTVAWLPEPARDPSPDSEVFNNDAKRLVFLSTVYNQYRDTVLAGKYDIPPRTELVLPFEADMMTTEEKERMDTQLLFEILLRRTIAAKIDFRLKGNASERQAPRAFKSEEGLSSSTSKSSKQGNEQNRRRSGMFGPHDRSQRTKSHHSSPGNSGTSLDTDEIMRHNASLLSELLPSPQVSFASAIFNKGPEPIALKARHSLNSRRSSKNQRKPSNAEGLPSPAKHTGNVDRSLSSLEPKRIASTPNKALTSSSVYSDGSPKKRVSPPEKFDPASEMFIYDFEKLNLLKKRPTEEKNLSNLNLFSLQPLNRSNSTFSTNSGVSSPGNISVAEGLASARLISSSENTPPGILAFDDHDITSLASTPSVSRDNHRASRSTAETSILHSLDNITNRVSEYLESEGGGTEYSSEFEAYRRQLDKSPTKSMKSPPLSMSDSLDFNILRTELMPPAPSSDTTNQPTPTSVAFSHTTPFYGSPPPVLGSSVSGGNDDVTRSMESMVVSLRRGQESSKGYLSVNADLPKRTEVVQQRPISSIEGSVHGGNTETSVSGYSRYSREIRSVAGSLMYEPLLQRVDSESSLIS